MNYHKLYDALMTWRLIHSHCSYDTVCVIWKCLLLHIYLRYISSAKCFFKAYMMTLKFMNYYRSHCIHKSSPVNNTSSRFWFQCDDYRSPVYVTIMMYIKCSTCTIYWVYTVLYLMFRPHSLPLCIRLSFQIKHEVKNPTQFYICTVFHS